LEEIVTCIQRLFICNCPKSGLILRQRIKANLYLKIHLIDINPELCSAWKTVFEEIPQIEIHHQSIFDFSFDALVSPANSYGYMNGGIDFLISKTLGWHIEKRLQEIIRARYYGELLVGQAEIVETDREQYPFLIAAPTMRHPMTIRNTPNVYLAMKAILILLRDGRFPDGALVSEKVKSVAIPGLGTGIGQVPAIDCARQMRMAWEDVMQENYSEKKSWEGMGANFAYFYTGDKAHLKYDIP
jgi:O-acetyl-ADP-ribose deacetylase (regulator of RNase III)